MEGGKSWKERRGDCGTLVGGGGLFVGSCVVGLLQCTDTNATQAVFFIFFFENELFELHGGVSGSITESLETQNYSADRPIYFL